MNQKLRQEVYDKFNGRCAYCGNQLYSFKNMSIDHVIPQKNFFNTIMNKSNIPSFLQYLRSSDVHHVDNLFPACKSCNNFKSAFHLELFRSELQKQVERAEKSSLNFRLAKRFGQVLITNNPVIFYFEKFKNYNI